MTAVSRRGLLLGGASLAAAGALGSTSPLSTAMRPPATTVRSTSRPRASTAGPVTPGPAWSP